MGCMMGFAIDTPASRMNKGDSEDTVSAKLDIAGRLPQRDASHPRQPNAHAPELARDPSHTPLSRCT